MCDKNRSLGVLLEVPRCIYLLPLIPPQRLCSLIPPINRREKKKKKKRKRGKKNNPLIFGVESSKRIHLLFVAAVEALEEVN